jgi:hypothetical protein
MTHAYAALALSISLLPLIALAARDPKRLRSRRSARRGATAVERRVFAFASLAPGIALAAIGQWPAFLLWLGSVARTRTGPATGN